MPWNPEIYNRFKSIRHQPFFDLAEFISEEGLENCIDIGCGTGEQTEILADRFEKVCFLGIDPSPEMLSESKGRERNNLSLKTATVEEFVNWDSKSWDLIFSNAALQWSDNHKELFSAILSRLSENGQFAVQMPVQSENLLNKILLDMVQEEPFAGFLDGWKRESPVLGMDEYAQIMFDSGLKDIQVIQKVYPIIANGPDELFDFISGSALIPYLERLAENEQEIFVTEYRDRIGKAFKKFPAIYAFKRLLLYGRKG